MGGVIINISKLTGRQQHTPHAVVRQRLRSRAARGVEFERPPQPPPLPVSSPESARVCPAELPHREGRPLVLRNLQNLENIRDDFGGVFRERASRQKRDKDRERRDKDNQSDNEAAEEKKESFCGRQMRENGHEMVSFVVMKVKIGKGGEDI